MMNDWEGIVDRPNAAKIKRQGSCSNFPRIICPYCVATLGERYDYETHKVENEIQCAHCKRHYWVKANVFYSTRIGR